MAFIADTVKPIIDRDFRTRPEREATGIAGLSLGGLISLYAYFRRPEVFGLAGVFSPAFRWGKRGSSRLSIRRVFAGQDLHGRGHG